MFFKKKLKDKLNGTYHFKGISEEEERKRQQNTVLSSSRLSMLMVVICVCIFILFARVFYITVKQKDLYDTKLDIYKTNVITSAVPRGSMYDRQGRELVSTKPNITVMYFPRKGTVNADKLEMAKMFVEVVDVDISKLTIRDKKDYLILYENKLTETLITEEEWDAYRNEELDDQDIYRLKLERITEDLINETWSEKELKYYHTHFLMTKNANEPNTIVEGITEQEASYIAEHSDLFPGFYISYSYNRVYNYGSTFKQVFGKVSSSTQGIPVEDKDRLLALGYQMTSSVGISGLEEQYESLLSGNSNQYSIEYDEDGYPIQNSITDGTKGYDLTLAVDWELQEYLNERIEYYISSVINYPKNKYFNSIFVTMMDPNNGDVLAMAGKQYDRTNNEFIDFPEGNYLTSYACGSTVKGATLYSGFKYGVIQVGEVMDDQPIKIQNTPQKASWRYLGYINDVTALANSSNVYMMHIVIRIGDGKYVYDQPLSLDTDAFNKLRESFGELGLGVLTGIDVPSEAIGRKGDKETSGLLLDYAIGQYDNYTVVQLAQYVSTIANGGKRVKPRLVLNAHYNDQGEEVVVYENPVEVLDDVSKGNEHAFARIQEGFIGTVSYGTVHGAIDASLRVAGKTGTAETYEVENGNLVTYNNRLFVAYAPYDNPRIAFACAAPKQEEVNNVSTCIHLAQDAMEFYQRKYGY